MNSSTDHYRLRPVVLKFADNSLENRFRAYHSERFMLQTRIGIALGLLLYGGFFTRTDTSAPRRHNILP